MLDIPSQHMHYCDLLLCEAYCFIVAYCVKASSVLYDETRAPPPSRGYSWKFLVGVYLLVLQILTLFSVACVSSETHNLQRVFRRI